MKEPEPWQKQDDPWAVSELDYYARRARRLSDYPNTQQATSWPQITGRIILFSILALGVAFGLAIATALFIDLLVQTTSTLGWPLPPVIITSVQTAGAICSLIAIAYCVLWCGILRNTLIPEHLGWGAGIVLLLRRLILLFVVCAIGAACWKS